MPTEHEYKFLLSTDILRDNQLWHVAHNICEILQGYISPETVNLRIRKKIQYFREEWYVTFKKEVGGRTIELEFDIDSRDGEDLWQICDRKLTKCRHTFCSPGALQFGWEIDVFFTPDRQPYLVMAEVELPEGSPPPEIPFWLSKYVLHKVDLTDGRFSNRILGDVEYATGLYREFVR